MTLSNPCSLQNFQSKFRGNWQNCLGGVLHLIFQYFSLCIKVTLKGYVPFKVATKIPHSYDIVSFTY